MSIFPTKLLLATDGSKEAELASRTAAELAQSTGSELHVLYVGEAPQPLRRGGGAGGGRPTGPRGARRGGRKGAGGRREGGTSSPEHG